MEEEDFVKGSLLFLFLVYLSFIRVKVWYLDVAIRCRGLFCRLRFFFFVLCVCFCPGVFCVFCMKGVYLLPTL